MPLVYADRGIREVTFKINDFGFTPAVLARLKTLVDLGFASEEPVEVRGTPVVPRAVLVAMLSRQAESSDVSTDGAEELVTVVRGAGDSGPVTITLRTLTLAPRWGIDPGSVMTGVPPAIVAAWIARGELRAPGVSAPESAIDPGRFFAELTAREIGTTVSTERPVGG